MKLNISTDSKAKVSSVMRPSPYSQIPPKRNSLMSSRPIPFVTAPKPILVEDSLLTRIPNKRSSLQPDQTNFLLSNALQQAKMNTEKKMGRYTGMPSGGPLRNNQNIRYPPAARDIDRKNAKNIEYFDDDHIPEGIF